MTMFLHGLGIGLLACGAAGLLAFAVHLFWQELKNLHYLD
jgi:hypothetical protein